MRAYYDRSGRYRGHSEGWPWLWLRVLAWLIILFWPFGFTALGGWDAVLELGWLTVVGAVLWWRTRP